MSLKLARVTRILGALSIVLGIVAVVVSAVQGNGLLGPGWIGVAVGLVVIVVARAAERSPTT